MDNIQMFFQNPDGSQPSCLDNIIDFIIHVLPLIVAIVVPLFTLRHTRKLKELELMDSKDNRKFEMKKVISERAIDVMARSYHLSHKINRALNTYHDAAPDEQLRIREEVQEAREYWEENLFYLPEAVRQRIIPLTNLTMVSFVPAGHDMGREAFTQVLGMFQELERAFARLMRDYNIFNEYSNSE